MQHDVFGNIVYLRLDEGWHGEAPLPEFANFGRFYESGGIEDGGVERKQTLPLAINDPEELGPSPQQQAAYRHLLDNEPAVRQAVLEGLFRSYRDYNTGLASGWLAKKLGVECRIERQGKGTACVHGTRLPRRRARWQSRLWKLPCRATDLSVQRLTNPTGCVLLEHVSIAFPVQEELTMFAALRRWLFNSSSPRRRKKRRALGFDVLEARMVPATRVVAQLFDPVGIPTHSDPNPMVLL